MTSTQTTGLVFSTFGKATVNDGSVVDISDGRRADFQAAAGYFSQHTNRLTLTVDTADIPAEARESKGDAEAEAKLLAKQIRQWAEAHNLSSAPKRDGSKVTFRFSKVREASKNGEVTVTRVIPPLVDTTAA